MGIFDLVFLALAVLMVLGYIKRGFVESILHFVKTVLAFVLAYLLCTPIASAVHTLMPNLAVPLCTAIGFAAGLLLVEIGLSVAIFFFSKLIQSISLVDRLNKILGGLLGAVIAFLYLVIIAAVFKVAFGGEPIYEDTVVLKLLGEWIADKLPLLSRMGI